MQDLFRFIIFIVSVYLVYLCIFFFTKRVRAVIKISSLRKTNNAKITYTRMPFSSYFKLSKKPDIIVEIGGVTYLIRLINGKGGLKFLHFASPEYFVTFSKIRISVSGLFGLARRNRVANSVSTSRHSVKILPPLEIPEEYTQPDYQNKTVPVLIFTPTPNEITYVTESKTKIKPAFEGDLMYGQMIFTPSTFVSYADRAEREERYKKEEEFLWK